MHPVDPITLAEAARILGCSAFGGGGGYEHRMLARADVETLALELYDWHRHLDDESSYWVTGTRAAAVLRVSRQRLDQLALADRVPYVRHVSGVRLYRRAQLGVMARRGLG